MTKIWPIKISDLINPQINDSEFIYVKNKISNKSARLMQRNGLDYYEYKDTATERNAPYKPEWIRTLCYVEDNKPNNKIVAWNKGHLLHQFTYFVGDVNFYYIKNGKKIVSIMNSGDSCYIPPYVPHSFTTRSKKGISYIVAVTYEDKINFETQKELLNLSSLKNKKYLAKVSNYSNSQNQILNFLENMCLSKDNLKENLSIKEFDTKISGKIDFSNNDLIKISKFLNINIREILPVKKETEVVVSKKVNYKKYFFPTPKNQIFNLFFLASSPNVPSSKGLELEVVKNNNKVFSISSHQYIYALVDSSSISINSKKIKMSYMETIYIKPFVKHSFTKVGSKFLILRIDNKISGDIKIQLSQMKPKDIIRIESETSQWF